MTQRKRISSKRSKAARPSTRTVAILHGAHERSRYVLSTTASTTKRTPARQLKKKQRAAQVRWFQLLNEVSVFSLLAAVFFLTRELARTLFRLPMTATPVLVAQLLPAPGFSLLDELAAISHGAQNTPETLRQPMRVPVFTTSAKSVPAKPVRQSREKRRPISFEHLELPLRPLALRAAGFALVSVLFASPVFVMATAEQLLSPTTNAFDRLQEEGARLVTTLQDRPPSTELLGDGVAMLDELHYTLTELPPAVRAVGESILGISLSDVERELALLRDSAQELHEVLDQETALPTVTEAVTPLLVDLERASATFAHAGAVLARSLAPLDAWWVPTAARERIVAGREELLRLTTMARDVEQLTKLGSDLLGVTGPRRYLVVFQNNAELRPTGGFLGSMAFVDVNDGAIVRWEMPSGGSYDIAGHQRTRLAPPQPLELVTQEWRLQDGNWWADWPTSAQQLMWFLEDAQAGTVDGVIAIDTTFVSALIDERGAFVDDSGAHYTETNFVDHVRADVRSRTHDQKQLLVDLAPQAIDALTELVFTEPARGIQFLEQQFAKKHLQLYLTSDAQDIVRALGWDGRLEPSARGIDTLAVINSNIAGQKTDAVIQNAVRHAAVVQSDGTIVVDVSVHRQHGGSKGTPETGVRNVNYLRVYVPRDSALIEARGFSSSPVEFFDPPLLHAETSDAVGLKQKESLRPDGLVRVSEELGFTTFGGWTVLDPGETQEIHLRYRLPWRVALTSSTDEGLSTRGGGEAHLYALRFHKQAGIEELSVSHALRIPNGFTVTEHIRGELSEARDGWQWSGVTTQDLLFGGIYE